MFDGQVAAGRNFNEDQRDCHNRVSDVGDKNLNAANHDRSVRRVDHSLREQYKDRLLQRCDMRLRRFALAATRVVETGAPVDSASIYASRSVMNVR